MTSSSRPISPSSRSSRPRQDRALLQQRESFRSRGSFPRSGWTSRGSEISSSRVSHRCDVVEISRKSMCVVSAGGCSWELKTIFKGWLRERRRYSATRLTEKALMGRDALPYGRSTTRVFQRLGMSRAMARHLVQMRPSTHGDASRNIPMAAGSADEGKESLKISRRISVGAVCAGDKARVIVV
ncbi:hypothetical protein B0H15DRAFT_850617 [Mycena belliarum]|uniref:Uncharacterized protein n=1 Tax=Mycena belliarum TaxID=1033014 RepID=A0AAD6XRY3_9AGAR|nr:hypothetical protein B0H15DRAFT_850617 [Mycena belliae]